MVKVAIMLIVVGAASIQSKINEKIHESFSRSFHSFHISSYKHAFAG
jgi:hypothetical protein